MKKMHPEFSGCIFFCRNLLDFYMYIVSGVPDFGLGAAFEAKTDWPYHLVAK